MKKLILSTSIILLSFQVSHAQLFGMPDCDKVMFSTGKITVGNCKDLEVYIARTPEQNACGMLKFTEDTFIKHGMLFISDEKEFKNRYFHTEGMKLTIRIMGLKEVGKNQFIVTDNDAKFSPPGLSSITIKGTHVFEITERMYKNKLNKCIYTFK